MEGRPSVVHMKADGEFWSPGKLNSNSLCFSDLREWSWDSQAGLGHRSRSSPRVQQESEYPNLKAGRTPLPLTAGAYTPGPTAESTASTA